MLQGIQVPEHYIILYIILHLPPHSASCTSASGVLVPEHATCTWAQLSPICKLHVLAASRSNLHRWMLVPGPPDLQQHVLVVFSFQPLAHILQLHSCNLHCVVAVVCTWWWLYVMMECGGGSCIYIYNYVVVTGCNYVVVALFVATLSFK